MKFFKTSFIALFFFLVGLSVAPTTANFESVIGKAIEGPEFVKIKAYPNVGYIYDNAYAVVHKDEIASLTADPSINNSALKYNLNLINGNKLTLTKETFEAALQQIDYLEMKS